MDTVAASLGACLAISISKTLGVMRQKLDDIEIRLSFERNEEEPKIFEYFNIHLILRGEALSPAKVEKAIHMSEESICPVSVILGLSGATMRTTFAIENNTGSEVPPATGARSISGPVNIWGGGVGVDGIDRSVDSYVW